MSNLSGIRDFNNTQCTQVPGPEIERILSFLKVVYDFTVILTYFVTIETKYCCSE